MSKVKAVRYHDISTGHRVYGHESRCSHYHGHNYRVTFFVTAEKLDTVGRVMDFSVIKSKLCMWLEDNWDHKFLIWKNDPDSDVLKQLDPDGVIIVDFNPTAENMGEHLLRVICPQQLKDSGCVCEKVIIEETRKCSATVEL